MPEEEKKLPAASEQTAASPEKASFSAAEALLAAVAVVLLLVIVLYSFFHSDRQADPVVVYLAETSGSAASNTASMPSDALLVTPGINLAAVSSGSTTSEMASATSESAASVEDEIPVVNINTASVFELTALPGIGEAKAAAIVAYREEFGDFLSVSQLLNVKGIGEKTLESIWDYIVLS